VCCSVLQRVVVCCRMFFQWHALYVYVRECVHVCARVCVNITVHILSVCKHKSAYSKCAYSDVYTHTHKHMCIHVCKHKCAYIKCAYSDVYTRTRVYICVNISVHILLYMCIVCVYVCVCARAWVNTVHMLSGM